MRDRSLIAITDPGDDSLSMRRPSTMTSAAKIASAGGAPPSCRQRTAMSGGGCESFNCVCSRQAAPRAPAEPRGCHHHPRAAEQAVRAVACDGEPVGVPLPTKHEASEFCAVDGCESNSPRRSHIKIMILCSFYLYRMRLSHERRSESEPGSGLFPSIPLNGSARWSFPVLVGRISPLQQFRCFTGFSSTEDASVDIRDARLCSLADWLITSYPWHAFLA